MPESILRLPPSEQAEIIRAVSAKTGRSPIVLEKDLWVCWMLQALFGMPGRKRMVFKGGTSLSKVFAVIDRFSEDIDLTVDYRDLDPGVDPFAQGLSNSQREKIREKLEQLLTTHLRDVIAPYLRETLTPQYGGEPPVVELNEGGDKLVVQIRSQFTGTGAYVRDGVLLEFGGRNVMEPHHEHYVQPYLFGHVAQLDLPAAAVDVLSPERTFWEKATLLHAECHGRDAALKGAERLSRHWYDLSRLADHEIGTRALANRALLADVVHTKKVIYRSAKAQYDNCVSGDMRLIPDGRLLDALREDFEAMQSAGMFEGNPIAFQEIIARLTELERAVNAAAD
jgi:hypothetical protein